MKIVLLESLGISRERLEMYAARLRAAGHTFTAYERDDSPAVKAERAKDADVIMIANMPLEAEVIEACSALKFIDVAFTGVDHVALEATRRKGVKVSNAAGYSTRAVSELALCMMLSLLRNVPQVEARCRAGLTKEGLVGSELCGKTVGIVGVGAIGGRVAELCHAFGCRVLGNRRTVRGDEAETERYSVASLPAHPRDTKAHGCAAHCPDEARCAADKHGARCGGRQCCPCRCPAQRTSRRCRC